MAQSFHPWFREYLTDLLQKHGSDFTDTPVYTKKKKVQITKFLTYGSQVQACEIWGEASDKQHVIPIKFTSDAISSFNKANPGQRFTQHKGAIVIIQNFRLVMTTVPSAGGGQADQPTLTIECSSVSILGSSGQPTFGHPLPIGSLVDVLSWPKGPNQGGKTATSSPSRHRLYQSPSKLSQSPPKTTSGQSAGATEVQIPLTRNGTHDLKSYTALWQPVARSRKFDMRPPANRSSLETESNVSGADLTREQSKVVQKARSRSASPLSGWEPSPAALRKPRSHVHTPQASKASFSQLPPTPSGQRRAGAELRPPEDALSYPMGNETVIESQPPTQARSKPKPMTRKIPRPASPEPPRGTGPVRILAPNSDTSGTQSQSQTFAGKSGRGILAAVNRRVEHGTMDEDYPWIDLWEMRAMMGRIMEAQKG